MAVTMEDYRKFFAESALSGLEKGLQERFSGKESEEMLEACGRQADKILNDYHSIENDAMQRHLSRSIAPAIGAYLALTERGTGREGARAFLEKIFMQAAEKSGRYFIK